MSTEKQAAPAQQSRNVQALQAIVNAARLAPMTAAEHEKLMQTAQALAQNINTMEASMKAMAGKIKHLEDSGETAKEPGPKKITNEA